MAIISASRLGHTTGTELSGGITVGDRKDATAYVSEGEA